MTRSRVVGSLLALGLGLAVVSVGSTGSAATDTRPPQLDTPTHAKMIVGQQIGLSQVPRVRELIKWTASDTGLGLKRVEVYLRYSEDDSLWYRLLYQGLGSSTTVTGEAPSPVSCTGFVPWHFEVRATDNAGNQRANIVGSSPQIADQTGVWTYYDETRTEFAVARTGTWGTSTFTGWYDGTTWKTTQVGASASYTRVYARGEHFALVMPKGPDRGSAAVYIDGVKKATVNTHQATKEHRVLVFDAWMPSGSHTVKVVNQATAGHPRIDIDAVLYNYTKLSHC
jgi:hypothetical protein